LLLIKNNMSAPFNIYLLSLFISFFLAILLFTKKGKSTADIILGSWLIVIGAHLWMYSNAITGQIFKLPNTMYIALIAPFLHGPFLLLYIVALTKPSSLNRRLIGINAITPIVILVINISFLFMTYDEKIEVLNTNGRAFKTQMFISNILLKISGLVYLVMNFKLLNDHKKNISNQFSNEEKINLNWIRLLVYLMTIMWVLIIIFKNDTYIFGMASIYVILMGYFGIKQVGIFSNQVQAPKHSEPIFIKTQNLENVNTTDAINSYEETIDVIPKKYAKSTLTEEHSMAIHQRLNALMKEEKLYKEPELTLDQLAAKLDVHPNYLSQVINEREDVNFYDFVNGLRVEEFKKMALLPENKHYTIIALAYECGFNSKSTFNRIFKKITGVSPSEYINNQATTP
jgi:AraC-like DNA-binding protein